MASEALEVRRPLGEKGLRRTIEVLSWRLAGYEAELRSVLEGYQRTAVALDSAKQELRNMGGKPLDEEEAEVDDKVTVENGKGDSDNDEQA
jgi:hypothetical protein